MARGNVRFLDVRFSVNDVRFTPNSGIRWHDCDDDCSVIRIGPTSVSVTANCRMTGRSGRARFLALKG